MTSPPPRMRSSKRMRRRTPKPDGSSSFAWAPALLIVEALKKVPEGAAAENIREYLAQLQGFAGINGVYDFKKFPQRGLGSETWW